MKKLLSAAFLVGVALVASGCGPKTPDGMPPLQPTTLTVTQEGSPVADATITLKSIDGSNNFTSGGTTGANGVATLVTHGQYKGVPVGKYKRLPYRKSSAKARLLRRPRSTKSPLESGKNTKIPARPTKSST